MWVSRSEWKSLKSRVECLEKEKASKGDTTFTVYDPDAMKHWSLYGFGYPMPSQTITLKQIVTKIMDNLGMKMTYVKGTPTTISIDAQSAASSASPTEEK